MHVAVDVAGSKEGKCFVQYIEDPDFQRYVIKGLEPVEDRIRRRGNTVNRELLGI
jgi:hypothetical protein